MNMQVNYYEHVHGRGKPLDTFTRPSILFGDLVKRSLARRWAL